MSEFGDLGPAFGASSVGAELFRTNPQAQTFVSMISSIYKRIGPLYDPDNALFEDANAWTRVLRDDRFRSYISMRLAKVARLTWQMEPASDRPEDVAAATTAEECFRQIPAFTSSRRHLAKFAFWGSSHAWIEGRREWRMCGTSPSTPRGHLAEWWVPTYIKPLDKRQVIYRTLPVKGEDGVVRYTTETLLGTIDAGVHEPMKNPECLVSCTYDDEVERLGYGRGLLETLYHIYWIKGIVRRIGLSGLEKWAHGIVAARLDSTSRGAIDDDTAALAQTTLDTLMAMRDNGAIVLDKNDELEVLTQSGAGGELTLKWLAYCDEGAAQLCLGSIRPTGGGEGGSLARTTEEATTTDDLLDCDREMIDEAITRHVVQLWWDLNQGPLLAMGLGTAKMPRFRSLHTDREDPEKVGRTLKLAQEIGMSISADDAHRRMGVKRPGANEETLEAPNPEPSGFGGFGGDPFASMGAGKPPAKPTPGAKPDEPTEPGPEALSAAGRVRRALAIIAGRG